MHTKLNLLSHDIIFVENGYHMRKLQAFEATGLKDSRTKSRAEYSPLPRRPSRGNPVIPVPMNVTGGILAAQDSTGIPVPVLCEHCCDRRQSIAPLRPWATRCTTKMGANAVSLNIAQGLASC